MRYLRMTVLGLMAATVLVGCDPTEKPDVSPVVSPTARGTVQTKDFATFVITMVNTQTLENNQPVSISSTLFDNTNDPHAFDEVFAAP